MNEQRRAIISLIKSSIRGTACGLPEDVDMSKAAVIAKGHRIVAMIYYGAVNCGVDKNSDPMRELFACIMPLLRIDLQQDLEIRRICEAFDREQISYMPMKGMVIKSLYPHSEMRSMGDADILIRLEQYDRIANIMRGLGYSFLCETDHELVWQKGVTHIELHKRVMTTYNKDFYAYYSDGWHLAKKAPDAQTRYVLSDEDFYVYMFVHFTKHYRITGIGIKHMVDLWIYRSQKPHMDEQYINAELKKLKLEVFHQNILQTMDAWFEDGKETSITEYITDVIFTSGEYGIAKNARASRLLQTAKEVGSVKKAKRQHFFRRMFLPYRDMCNKYQLLKKVPILLPIFWVVRWVEILLFKREKVRHYMQQSAEGLDEAIIQRQQALEFVGLDFVPEEKA